MKNYIDSNLQFQFENSLPSSAEQFETFDKYKTVVYSEAHIKYAVANFLRTVFIKKEDENQNEIVYTKYIGVNPDTFQLLAPSAPYKFTDEVTSFRYRDMQEMQEFPTYICTIDMHEKEELRKSSVKKDDGSSIELYSLTEYTYDHERSQMVVTEREQHLAIVGDSEDIIETATHYVYHNVQSFKWQ